MKGNNLIKFIKENSLEDKNVYIHKSNSTRVVEVTKEELIIDEIGDLLVASK